MEFIAAVLDWAGPIAVWLLVLQLLGLIALPIVSRIASRLDDGGYFTSKAVALVLVTFLTWAVHHLIGYGRGAIILAVVIVALVSAVLWRRRPFPLRLGLTLQAEAVFFIVFFAFLFIQMYHPFTEGGAIMTLYTGERFMDSAFMHAINRADSLPPTDPWLAGERLYYYYYFGYLTGASLSELTTIPLKIALNLGTPTLAALTAMLAFGLGRNLTGRASFGLLATVFVTFSSNLNLIPKLADQFSDLGVSGTRGLIASYWDDYYWAPTRALFGGHQGITEFPFFTFMWGSFHPNAIGIPFQLLVIALLLAQLRAGPITVSSLRREPTSLLRVGVLAVALGYLFANNAWDYPAYAALIFFALFIHHLRAGLQALAAAAGAAAPVILSVILYAPYIIAFDARATEGILPWEMLGRTNYPSQVFNTEEGYGFIFVFGLFLFAIAAYLVVVHRPWESLRRLYPRPAGLPVLLLAAVPVILLASLFSVDLRILVILIPVVLPGLAVLSLAAVSVILLASFLSGAVNSFFVDLPDYRILVILIPVVLLGLWAILRLVRSPYAQQPSEESPPGSRLLGVSLILAGAGVIGFAEIFYVKDYLQGGEFQRMNTVFKFYSQAWILWGIAAAYGSYAIWQAAVPWLRQARGSMAMGLRSAGLAVWLIPLTGLTLLSLVYAPLAINSWTRGLRPEPTLDGTAYLKEPQDDYHPDQLGCLAISKEACTADYEAIEWLNENIDGQPAVVEAMPPGAPYNADIGTDYTYFARVASLTGLPTIVGQIFHEFSWGNQTEVTEPRVNDITEIFQTEDPQRAAELMHKYDAKLVFIGSLEQQMFGDVFAAKPASRSKFDTAPGLFEKTYDHQGVTIYRLLQ